MLTQSCLQLTTSPTLKTKDKIQLLLASISGIEVRTPEIPDPSHIYELDFNTFQLTKGVIPLDVMYHVDHKTSKTLTISKSIPDANILEVARKRLQQLLDVKYNSIVFKSAADISRTNLIELHIPTEGPPVQSKPYSVPLKYREFVKHGIKQHEEAEIISRSKSDLASPILVILKKEE